MLSRPRGSGVRGPRSRRADRSRLASPGGRFRSTTSSSGSASPIVPDRGSSGRSTPGCRAAARGAQRPGLGEPARLPGARLAGEARPRHALRAPDLRAASRPRRVRPWSAPWPRCPSRVPLLLDFSNFDGMGALLHPLFRGVPGADRGRRSAGARGSGRGFHLEAIDLPASAILRQPGGGAGRPRRRLTRVLLALRAGGDFDRLQ